MLKLVGQIGVSEKCIVDLFSNRTSSCNVCCLVDENKENFSFSVETKVHIEETIS